VVFVACLQLEDEGVGSVSNQRRVGRVIAGGQSRIKVVDEFSYLVFHVLPSGVVAVHVMVIS
jgi:hypothetical protein